MLSAVLQIYVFISLCSDLQLLGLRELLHALLHIWDVFCAVISGSRAQELLSSMLHICAVIFAQICGPRA